MSSMQMALPYRIRGGRRDGAGRKPKADREGPTHQARPRLAGRHPVHVTLKTVRGLPSLRSQVPMRVMASVLRGARDRLGLRVCHWSVQGNHVHLVVEADDAAALSRGMKGLGVRTARQLNNAIGRKGRVIGERYHAVQLTSPAQVRYALRYVLLNARHHARESVAGKPAGLDGCSSGAWFDGWSRAVPGPEPHEEPPIAAARTWLLCVGWRRHGLISPDDIPGRA
jgi:REP element-mobilizing transposase RayT